MWPGESPACPVGLGRRRANTLICGQSWSAARGGGLRARWVPAHRPYPDPPLLTEMDWHGNGEAGRLAGEALIRLRPDPALRAAALQAEHEYAAVVAVGSAALEAQLA